MLFLEQLRLIYTTVFTELLVLKKKKVVSATFTSKQANTF